MMDIYSKYDNMNTNGIFYTLICINNVINSNINCMLSETISLVVHLNSMCVLLLIAVNHGLSLHQLDISKT